MVKQQYGIDILAFAPHPDDAEMRCGGLLLSMARKGYTTGIIDMTRGELGTNGTPALRAEEAAAASKVLGLTVRENLELPDGWLHPWAGYEEPVDQRPTKSHVARVVEVLRRLRPEIVVMPWTQARHPDHRAASAILEKALFFCGLRNFETAPQHERFVPRQVLQYQMRYRFRPSFIVDISDVAKEKYEAAMCFASQFVRKQDASVTLINRPGSVESNEHKDQYYGAMIGVSHGEPYLCHNTLAIDDPLAHFRQNDHPPALFCEEMI
ncbi:MAG TPA: bacillithiol biosynthesis deacetylase BshB1 [Myxococcales bacterium]|nr:bacillithiol biosynthesis deacetylase BshB1 [Deltaproteobacteria bacterium]MBU49200.1 bacillithiol biosynthesis deacetylase BshB1 [Deltaproteobacteria bacterium]HAA55529.1 bacillithiol biosynthesis deacetylase BshB1 [Myxococcales bacterium]|tara:strand:- start:7672 stop:8472 length:801 start_codon:yes stop_codon:yes gene_type:complete